MSLTDNRTDYDEKVKYVPGFFKVMLPQSSEFDASFQGKDNGEKPVKYLCLLDTRSQLLLRKQDSNKTCSHHISQIS